VSGGVCRLTEASGHTPKYKYIEKFGYLIL